MATKSKSDWKQFFSFEKELLDFLSQQKIIAGDKADLRYLETPFRNTILQRPPKFIHCLISLGGDESLIKKVETDIDELKNRFRAVSDKNFPSRFPQLLKQPLQINLSQHQAFRSRVIDAATNEFIPVKRYSSDSDDISLEDVTSLKNIGITSQVIDTSVHKTLNISTHDLILYAKGKKLTVRTNSGLQFTARVRYPDTFQSIRVNFGLLIVPNDCPTLSSLPQPPRSHRLESSAVKIILPINIDSEIFVKQS